ncbi:MAG TPA: nitrilase-related carbon-nitrogen hydrolase [Nitrososphaerales archaeon]|nr:nitrilase-related carbon-nitrogen hydrolase [Nitrososphaerales archaeon]
MSDLVTLGLVQMSMSEDKDENLSKALGMIEEVASKGSQIVCLPELFATRYFPQTEKSKIEPEKIPGPTSRFLSNAARKNCVVIVGGSIFETDGKKRYNTSAVFGEDGKMLGKYRKVHIPQDKAFYEQDYFSSGKSYPTFETSSGRIGALICFDQWYSEPARIERLGGAEVLFYPTAIGTVADIEQSEGNWHEAWEAVQRGHAISNSMIVVAVNRVGKEGEMKFWGGSFVYDQFGKLLARAGVREEVLAIECDLSRGETVERGWGFLQNRVPSTYSRLTSGAR